MDQQMITAIVIGCFVIVGAAVLLATIYFGPNMKKDWRRNGDREYVDHESNSDA